MRAPRPKLACPLLLAAALLAGSAPDARAVSCTVSASMAPGDRTLLEGVATTIGEEIARGDAGALKSASAPSLAANFGDIAATVASLSPGLKGSTITVENLFALHARDLTGAGDDAQFFCSRTASPLLVTVTLGQVPPGEYALAIVHATGVLAPQQFALILQNSSSANAAAQWELAGFFVRPLTIAGHAELWFWIKHAR